jgi:Tol biopolymer transport system component
VTVVERLADGQVWEIDTQERRPSFTPDGQNLMWIVYDEDAPRDSRSETIWLANADGSNRRNLTTAQRTSAIAWLSNEQLLLSRRFAGTSDEQLLEFSLLDGTETELMAISRPRGLALSPDRRYLVYYVSFEPEAEKNGMWLIDLQNPGQGPQKLPFFGAYRWRDARRLVYVPLEVEAEWHIFYEYDANTGAVRPLLPEGTNLRIANNDWQISPDGSKIALLAAQGMELDGIWIVEIGQN